MANKKLEPTMQGGNIKRYANKVSARLDQIQNAFLPTFNQIPVTRRTVKQIQNAEQLYFYEYEVTEQTYTQLQNELNRLFDQFILQTGGNQKPLNWFLDENIEQGTRAGFLDANNQYAQMIRIAERQGVQPKQIVNQEDAAILNTQAYIDAVQYALVSNWAPIVNMSDDTIYQIMQVVRAGIAAGEPPRAVAKKIRRRFAVSQSRAAKIARTEINKAFNDGKMQATRVLADQTGYTSGVIHISALTPRTRSSHAARHGNAYTLEAQERWWDEGANRINCLCSTRPVILDSSGNVVAQELVDEIRSERKVFGIEPAEGD